MVWTRFGVQGKNLKIRIFSEISRHSPNPTEVCALTFLATLAEFAAVDYAMRAGRESAAEVAVLATENAEAPDA